VTDGSFPQIPRQSKAIAFQCPFACDPVNGRKHTRQAGIWFDFIELTGLNNGCKDYPVLHACVVACDERVFLGVR